MFAAEAVVVVAAVAGGSFAHSRKRGTQTANIFGKPITHTIRPFQGIFRSLNVSGHLGSAMRSVLFRLGALELVNFTNFMAILKWWTAIESYDHFTKNEIWEKIGDIG